MGPENAVSSPGFRRPRTMTTRTRMLTGACSQVSRLPSCPAKHHCSLHRPRGVKHPLHPPSLVNLYSMQLECWQLCSCMVNNSRLRPLVDEHHLCWKSRQRPRGDTLRRLTSTKRGDTLLTLRM